MDVCPNHTSRSGGSLLIFSTIPVKSVNEFSTKSSQKIVHVPQQLSESLPAAKKHAGRWLEKVHGDTRAAAIVESSRLMIEPMPR
jgi:hypothetical protein